MRDSAHVNVGQAGKDDKQQQEDVPDLSDGKAPNSFHVQATHVADAQGFVRPPAQDRGLRLPRS